MNIRHLVLGILGAATLVPAAASAQSFEGYGPPPTYYGQDDRRDGYGEPLQDRVERVRQWMRRGMQDGWLDGWRARRAWGEFRVVAEESRGDDYARRDAWLRLDRLTSYLRWARQNDDG